MPKGERLSSSRAVSRGASGRTRRRRRIPPGCRLPRRRRRPRLPARGSNRRNDRVRREREQDIRAQSDRCSAGRCDADEGGPSETRHRAPVLMNRSQPSTVPRPPPVSTTLVWSWSDVHGGASPAGDDADGGAALDRGGPEWATGWVVGDGEAVGNVAAWAADGGGGEVGEGLARRAAAARDERRDQHNGDEPLRRHAGTARDSPYRGTLASAFFGTPSAMVVRGLLGQASRQ